MFDAHSDGALCPELPPGTVTGLGAGVQMVSKGRQTAEAANEIQVPLPLVQCH